MTLIYRSDIIKITSYRLLSTSYQHSISLFMDKILETINYEQLCTGWDITIALQQTTRFCILNDLLEKLFEHITPLSWLHIEQQGALFLKSTNKKLILCSHHGFSEKQATSCERIPIGKCSCSEVLQSGTVTILPCDGKLIFNKDDKESCQNYFALPLSNNENETFGIITLLISKGHQPSETEKMMMDKLADSLSLIVSRIQTNEVLFVKQLEINESKKASLSYLGKAAEFRDTETGMHVLRMANYAGKIAKYYGLSPQEREILTTASPMHDVGKIGIPDNILLQPRRLTTSEFDVMKTHSDIGWQILEGEDELMVAAREIAISHHEKWNGTGYPKGLKGKEISVYGRITSLADVFDALTSERPYKKAWSVERAVETIKGESGISFDPDVVAAFIEALPEILRIKALFRDDIIDPHEKLALPPLAESKEAWIPWDEKNSVGIDAVDEQHQYLFRLTNNLHSAISKQHGSKQIAYVLNALKQYTVIHFREEERMMKEYNYPRLDIQLAQHQFFIQKIDEFWETFKRNPLCLGLEIMYYLRDWLVNHIQKEDKRLIEITGNSSA